MDCLGIELSLNYTKGTMMKVRVRVGKSRIAGQGLFTAQDITQDTRIIQYIGERISKAESAKRIDLTFPIRDFSEHSCVFPADSP